MDLLIPEFDFTLTFQSIVVSQLFGFACWSILMLFIHKAATVARLDRVIIVFTLLLGALSLLSDVHTLTGDYFSQSEYQVYITNSEILNYWHYSLLKTIIIVLASQSLWVKHVRNSKWLRVILSLLIFFFLFFERIVILIRSLHRDYLPSFGWEVIQSLLVNYLELFIGFILLTSVGYLLRLDKLIDSK